MRSKLKKALRFANNISKGSLSIYDPIEIDNRDLWIPNELLEVLLNSKLIGFNTSGYANRTRSKVVKSEICKVLGYPIPPTFKKTNPRFPGQDFDTYVQKSNNLQIWNEEVEPTRRYVIIKVSADDIIEKVKVFSGERLAELDTTGTLTRKFQARLKAGIKVFTSCSKRDTKNIALLLKRRKYPLEFNNSPIDYPDIGSILPIKEIFERISGLIGETLSYSGYDQERSRGSQLHEQICYKLGYQIYKNGGFFPDIRNQLLEVKLQTSQTIDLGKTRPTSTELLGIPPIEGCEIRCCDSRYAIFYGSVNSDRIVLEKLYVTTGEDFLDNFELFGGNIVNKKIQIPLPKNFFDG